jgi:RNA polymerase sigma-70 factor (ECF subfamily)
VAGPDPDEPGSDTEQRAHAAWDKGDFEATATIVLEGYGTEFYSFLLAQFQRNWDQADDVFSTFKEDLWRGLPAFQWRCSVRAWCYRLVRNAVSRYRRSPPNRRARHVSFDDVAFLDDFVERARTTTQLYLRTEVKNEIQKLRDELTPEDRDLLALRVDRGLPWRDVAHAMLAEGEPVDDQRIQRLEASLRQRFVEVKNRLKRLAKERGLL